MVAEISGLGEPVLVAVMLGRRAHIIKEMITTVELVVVMEFLRVMVEGMVKV
jgi:hypothetical protein